jgi:Transglutaminase-like superfamily
MVNSWQAFWRLKGLERGIVLEAAGGLVASWIGLRVLNFNRWRGVMERFASAPAECEASRQVEQAAAARRIAHLESGAARRLFVRTNCLEQSLTLWWLLRREGIASELRIGARKDTGRFEAHAWVEAGGEVLEVSGEEHRHFVPFDGPLESVETKAQ